MTFDHVQRLEGTLTGANKKKTIVILVARSIDKFTDPAKDRAKVARSAGYNIILTDENNLYSDLINFIESRQRLDSSNNIDNFFYHFYNNVKILLLVLLLFILVLIWLNLNQTEDVSLYIY